MGGQRVFYAICKNIFLFYFLTLIIKKLLFFLIKVLTLFVRYDIIRLQEGEML